ncbi:MAG: hypothetical protein LR015_09360 [Verrucomicrobia bacterium]|nr:hypothetical protein [Verrucomicrobiota bacterium]
MLDGLKALLVYLIYIFIPILLASLIFGIFNTIFSFLKLQLLAWSLAFLPFVPILALAPSVLVAALSQHARSGSFDDLLRVDKPVKIALKALPQLLLPTLALYGLLILGYPIFPFAAFFAFTLYAAYCTALFKSQRKTSSKSI